MTAPGRVVRTGRPGPPGVARPPTLWPGRGPPFNRPRRHADRARPETTRTPDPRTIRPLAAPRPVGWSASGTIVTAIPLRSGEQRECVQDSSSPDTAAAFPCGWNSPIPPIAAGCGPFHAGAQGFVNDF